MKKGGYPRGGVPLARIFVERAAVQFTDFEVVDPSQPGHNRWNQQESAAISDEPKQLFLGMLLGM